MSERLYGDIIESLIWRGFGMRKRERESSSSKERRKDRGEGRGGVGRRERFFCFNILVFSIMVFDI